MTSEERGFLTAIKENPDDVTARGAYADWLDEHDRHYEAVLQRAEANLSEVYFKLRRKSDGLFSEGRSSSGPIRWTTKGKMWRRLSDLRSHMANMRPRNDYGGKIPWSDLEVVVLEVRVTVAATLPISAPPDPRTWGGPTITEPLGGDSKGSE